MENAWDQIAQHRHHQLLSGEDHTFNEILLPQIIEILDSLGNLSNFKVLDIGCGTGVMTEILSHQVNEIIGIDPSQKSISIANSYIEGCINTRLECVSIEDFAEDHKEEFDLAIAHMTLHAIEDIGKAISGVSTILKMNGWFLFSILHPCFWHIIKSNMIDNNFKYHIPSPQKNTFQFTDGFQADVPWFHRPLSVYCSTLRFNGLSIVDMSEPFPNEILMEKYSRPWFLPGFLFILCKKTQIGGS
jgi:2-polyprenyl-3-methyl-5-hydroxy-6-metoxy-1,4-benzoquinol methylase